MPPESAEPGKFRVNRAPWVRDICDAVANPLYTEVITVQGSQTSKTETLLNTIGWQMDYRRKPALYFAPTEDNAKAISERMLKMFLAVPSLCDGLPRKNATKPSVQYHIYGIRCGLGWGGSKTQVASHPAELTVFDELDRTADIPGEGSPWQLVKARNTTYPGGCQIGASSPTLGLIEDYKHPETGLIHWRYSEKVVSLSWQLWQEGTRAEFMLPCPECGVYFAPKIKLLYIPSKSTPSQAAKEVRLICPHCGGLIHPHHQNEMIDHGLMISPGQHVLEGKVIGEKPITSIASFHINGLCSRWVSWSKRTFELTRVRQTGQQGRIQAFVNTEGGECYWVQGKAPLWEEVAQLAIDSDYRMGEIPARVQTLTAGVDVQGNRLVVVVMGWALVENELEGWVIDYDEVFGNTAENEVWAAFSEKYLGEIFNGFKLTEVGVDSGFNPSAKNKEANDENHTNRNIIYEFCRAEWQVIPTKGSPRPMAKPYYCSTVDVNHRGKNDLHGLSLWTMDTDFYKKWLYATLKRERDKAGCWHFPVDTPEKFFKELTAEQLAADGTWITTKDNHVLDAAVINLFLTQKNKFKTILPSIPLDAERKEVKPAYKSPEPIKDTVQNTPVIQRRSVVRGGLEGWD